MAEPRPAGRFPGGAGLREVECGCGLPQVLERQHFGLGGLGALDLLLKLAGMDLRAVVGREQQPDFVGRTIDPARGLGGGTMEEIDETPAELLGLILQDRVGEQREQVRPDRGERLIDRLRFGSGKDAGARLGADREVPEFEGGELGGKGCRHERSPVRRRMIAATQALHPAASGTRRHPPARLARAASRGTARGNTGRRRAGCAWTAGG